MFNNKKSLNKHIFLLLYTTFQLNNLNSTFNSLNFRQNNNNINTEYNNNFINKGDIKKK